MEGTSRPFGGALEEFPRSSNVSPRICIASNDEIKGMVALGKQFPADCRLADSEL